MKAVRYHKPKDVRVDEVEEPSIEDDRDIILKVTSTAICGSDLHILNGMVPQLKEMTLGHEFMGIVEETGDAITRLMEGDRVIVPFPIADGDCWYCQKGLPTACENSNPRYGPEGHMLKGKGAALFGYTDLYGGKNGGQAEKVRVPFADYGPRKVPEGPKDETFLLLTDVIPTAWQAAQWADIQEGETVAVYGCGPVGLMTQRIAKDHFGAGKVIGVDIEPYRLDVAKRNMGSLTVNPHDQEAEEFIRDETDGHGADVCIDAVGMEAERTIVEKATNVVQIQVGTIKVLKNCFESVRRGGRVSVVGVYGMPYSNFPLGQMFDKGLRMRLGQANVHEVIDPLMEKVQKGELWADDIISHRLPLEDAEHGYEIFQKKEEDCTKVVLKP